MEINQRLGRYIVFFGHHISGFFLQFDKLFFVIKNNKLERIKLLRGVKKKQNAGA